jgi:predicted DsbA family dithiol-disulfide isomerase
VKIVYYLDVTSSWCHWAEPAWADLQKRYAGRVAFEWKIALLAPADFPVSRPLADWFYRRSGTVMRSPARLNSSWLEPERKGLYEAPNLVAEAARPVSAPQDETVRLALAHAAVIDGRGIGDLGEAVTVAATAAGLDPTALRQRAESAEIRGRVATSTAEFRSHQINQRPAFVLTDTIGDKVVFSGLATAAPVAAALDAMLADSAAYAAHAAQFGPPPAA